MRLEPALALGGGFEEGRRSQHGERQCLLLTEAPQGGLEAGVGDLRHLQLLMAGQFQRQPLPEGHADGGRQLEIVHRDGMRPQGIAEAAHRHEGMQQAQLVVAVGGGHRQVFDHQHPAAGVELQRRGAEPVAVQLIAQDQGQDHGFRTIAGGASAEGHTAAAAPPG